MVYVHIPFCRSRCIYCGFYSNTVAPGPEFVDELCAEALRRKDEIAATNSVNTLYTGGGTPSVLPLADLGRIADACGGRCYREWTVEVNPDDVTLQYARGLRELGVNRVSMGVQSLSDDILRWMRRRHDADGARRAFRSLRAAGFDNISVDIIFGINGLSLEMLRATVEEILSWRPEHISAYALSVDDGSALGRLCNEGKYCEVDGDDHYDYVCSALASAGYEHYEISNWALPGRRAVHNSAYWTHQPYVGLGPGAHSLQVLPPDCVMASDNRRKWNSRSLSGWTVEGEEVLTDRELWEEKMMLGLRTADGIPQKLLTAVPLEDEDNYTPGESLPNPRRYIDKLVPSAIPGNLRIPEDLWYTADDIISGLLDLS